MNYSQPSSWDAVSQLHPIPFAIRSCNISFPDIGTISHSELYIECVEDDILTSGVDDGVYHHYKDAGQYAKGDLIKTTDLHVVNSAGSVCIINNTGGNITVPMGNAGALDRPAKGVFVIEPGNKKYKLRCFASCTPLPQLADKPSYWDKTITYPTPGTTPPALTRRLTIPHTLGMVPDIVELNFQFIRDQNGFKIGDIVPLKFIGGRQVTISGQPTSNWTISADATNIYLGVSGSQIIAVTAVNDNHTQFNIYDLQACKLLFNIKKKYPNPYNIDFFSRDLPKQAPIDSSSVDSYSGSGELLDCDLILEPGVSNANSGFGLDERLYFNQMGWSFAEDCSYIFHNNTLEREGANHRLHDPKHIPQFTGEFRDNVPLSELQHRSYPNNSDNMIVAYDSVRNSMMTISTDTASAWRFTFRWQYEGGAPGYDADSGWIPVEKNGLRGTGLNFNMAQFWDKPNAPSKVDIFLRIPQDDFNGMPLGSTFAMANNKGRATCYHVQDGGVITNNWTFHYNKVALKSTNYTQELTVLPNVPSIPNWTGTDTKDSGGLSLDNGVGSLQIRFCAHK